MEHVHAVPNPNSFLVGWFDAYPYSHSLFMLIVWGALYGFLYRARTGDKRAALVIGILVVSHWVLDVITHRPDMPLYPGGPEVGLGLWNSAPATIAVEALMLLFGVAIYVRTTRAREGALKARVRGRGDRLATGAARGRTGRAGASAKARIASP